MHTFDWMLVFTIRYPYIHYYVRYESVDGDGGLFGNPTEDGLNASGMVGMVMRGVCYYTNIYLGKFKKTGLAINRNVAFFLHLVPLTSGFRRLTLVWRRLP